MTLSEFVNYSNELIDGDADAREFVDEDTKKR